MSLRERKKRLAQSTIEETALRLFQERGYEQTSIQNIADEVMLSPRTFFRYFASKEELLFGPTQAVLNKGITYLENIPHSRAPLAALTEMFIYLADLYQEQKETFLLRYQIAMVTPSLVSVYLYSLALTEPALCQALSTRQGQEVNPEYVRFLVAVSMAAFRVTLTAWFENNVRDDLTTLLRTHLTHFTTLSQEIRIEEHLPPG